MEEEGEDSKLSRSQNQELSWTPKKQRRRLRAGGGVSGCAGAPGRPVSVSSSPSLLLAVSRIQNELSECRDPQGLAGHGALRREVSSAK